MKYTKLNVGDIVKIKPKHMGDYLDLVNINKLKVINIIPFITIYEDVECLVIENSHVKNIIRLCISKVELYFNYEIF